MVHYVSTRGGGKPKSFSDVLLSGTAPDGGLYAGVGWFTSQVARWSGRSWQNLGGQLDGTIADMALSGTTLYVVGDFAKAGTASARLAFTFALR